MKHPFLLLILFSTYHIVVFGQINTYTLNDTLRADELMKPLTNKEKLCDCTEQWQKRYGEAYAIYKATLTDKHKKTMSALLNLSKSHYVKGDVKKAFLLSEQALTTIRQIVPPEDSIIYQYLEMYADTKLNLGAKESEMLPLLAELHNIAFRYADTNGKLLKINWLKKAKDCLWWNIQIKGLPDDLDKTIYDLHKEVYGKNHPKTVKALMIWAQSLNNKNTKEKHKKIEEAIQLAETVKKTAPDVYFEILDLVSSNETDRAKQMLGIQNNLLYLNKECGKQGACLDRDGQQASLLTYTFYDIYTLKNSTQRDYNTVLSLYTQFLETAASNLYKLGAYLELAKILQSKADEQATMGDTTAFRDYYHNALHYAFLADSLAQYRGVVNRKDIWSFMADFYIAMKEPDKAVPYLRQVEQVLVESDILLPGNDKQSSLSQLYNKFETAYTLLGQMDSVVQYAERNAVLFNTQSGIFNLFKDQIHLRFYQDFKVFAYYLKTNRVEKAEILWQKWTSTEGLLTQNPCLKGILVLNIVNLFGVPQCFDFFKTHNINIEDEDLLILCNSSNEAASIPLIIGYLLSMNGKKEAAIKALERTPQLFNISYDSLDNVNTYILSVLNMTHSLTSELCGELSLNTQSDEATRHFYTQKAFQNAESAYKVTDVFRRSVRNTPWEGVKESPDFPSRYMIWNAVKYAIRLIDFNNTPLFRTLQIQKAFQYSEIARAKTLLESMLYREAIGSKPASNDTLSTLIYQDTLLQNILTNKELDVLTLSLGGSGEHKQLTKLQSDIVDIRSKIDLVKSQLKQKLDVKIQDHIVSIPQVQTALKHDEALIEYLWDKTALHTFVIKKDTFWTETVDSIEVLDGLINRYLDLIQDRSHLGLSSRLHKKADSLWRYLFLPLNIALLPQKLIIVPHRTIALLPFEALRDGQQYLIEKYNIRYAYSATTLLKMQNLNITNTGFVGFAPFATPSVSLVTASRYDHFVPLPETQNELDTIKNIMNGVGYYYQDATKDRFIQEAVKYAYIHLPTHAESPNNNTARIAFFNQEKVVWGKKAALYGREIYQLKFNADLISLSACETFGTKQNNDESEGIMGLARGFSQAGVKSVLSTLWVVDAEKTSQFMVQFYQNLKKGKTKSEALQQVKRQMIQHKETAHPYFWAAPVLIGDSGEK